MTTLLQDSRGFLWIGTSGGLSRYDGYSFTNYDRRHGLPTADISCLLESKRNPGRMWVGTSGGGLAILDGDTFRSAEIKGQGHTNIVSYLEEDPSGTLWVATFGGLFVYDTSVHPVLPLPHLRAGSYIKLIDSTNLCFAYADSLVLLTDRGQINAMASLRGHSHGFVTYQEVLSDGSIIVATSDSTILRFDDSLRLLEKSRHKFAPIETVYEDESGWVWFGTQDGLYAARPEMLINGTYLHYGKKSGLPSGEISALLKDSEGNFWVGGMGLHKLGTSGFLKFPMPGISGAYDNRRAVVDSAGHFWVATQSAEIVEIWKTEQGDWRQYSHHNPDLANALLLYDSRHRLWAKPFGKSLLYFKIAGKKGSRSRLVGRTVQLAREDFAEHAWATFIVTKDNHLWSSVDGVGILHADLDTRKVLDVYGKAEGVPRDLSIRVIYEDRDKNIWLGGFQEGVAVTFASNGYQPPFKKITVNDGLPDNWIRAITQDQHERMWIGTRRAGIAVQIGDSLRIISTLNGLANDAVWGLVEDGDDMWAATQTGFQRIRSATLDPVSMQKEFIISGVGACGSDGKGTLWFATLDAFYLYDYARGVRILEPPPVHITSVEVNGLPRLNPDHTSLSYNENNWTVTFVGLSFRHEGDLRYQYRLSGTDEQWSPPNQTRTVSFSSLVPGEYEFQVRAVTPDGISDRKSVV